MSQLSFGKSSQGFSNSIKVGEGVYVIHNTVKGARVEYNTSMIENSQYKDDIALRMLLNVDGKDWDKELYIGGNFKREGSPQGGTPQISGWGSAFRVARVFDELGIEGTLVDGRFEQSAIEMLIGRELFYLQYVRGFNNEGKVAYADYRLVGAQRENEEPKDTAERLFKMFSDDLQGGYISNYDPSVLGGSKPSGDGASVNTNTEFFGSTDNSEWV